jgi:YYY domain-containing protein
MSGLLLQWLQWLVAVQVVAIAAWPITFNALRRLPDRGYFASKAVGILLFSVVFWLGASLGLLRNELGGALLALAAVATLGRSVSRRSSAPSCWVWARGKLWLVLAAEAVFVAAFALCAAARAFDPAADHTERPMDLLLLSGIHASPMLPPRDPWLSGYAISYYYLGHWMLNGLSLLAGLPPAIAYNVGLACWFGLLVSGCFGVSFNLLQSARPGRPRQALAAGVLGALAIACAGNPQGALDALQRQGLALSWLAQGRLTRNFVAPDAHWWWWRSSRALADEGRGGERIEIIDEFPAFSYVVGDAHAHVLAMPFVLVCVALTLNLHLTLRNRGEPRPEAWALHAVALGALLFLNTWDYPAQWLLFVLVVWAARGRLRAVALGALALGASVAIYLPYFLTSQSQAEGLRSSLAHPTPLGQLLLMFGGLLCGITALLPRTAADQEPRRPAVAWAVLAVPGVMALLMTLGGLPTPWTLASVAMLLGLVMRRGVESRDRAGRWPFVLLLAAVGLVLVLVPEIVYVQDGFGTRMNTVFKMYYEAWLLLGLSAVHGTILASEGRAVSRIGAALFLLAGGAGLVYTIAAIGSKTRSVGVPTFDALAYLRQTAPAEWAATQWVRRELPGDAIVVQGKGASYRPEQSRLSVATGRATLLGWEGHELQWRGRAFPAMTEGRDAALESIYRRGDAASLLEVLDRFGIDAVFVGPFERQMYGIDASREALLSRVLERAFAEADVTIYRRRAFWRGAR